jgi:hypothetical protein
VSICRRIFLGEKNGCEVMNKEQKIHFMQRGGLRNDGDNRVLIRFFFKKPNIQLCRC